MFYNQQALAIKERYIKKSPTKTTYERQVRRLAGINVECLLDGGGRVEEVW